MIIKEKINNQVIFMPLKSMESTFFQDLNYLKLFIKNNIETYNHEGIIERGSNIIQSINSNINSEYPLFVFKIEDLIFFQEIMIGMISDKVDNFSKDKLDENMTNSIQQGILFLKALTD